MLRYRIQLQDRPLGAFAGPAIIAAGGQLGVYPAGTQAKVALFDKAGAAIANPMPFVRGGAEFYVANTHANEAMDLFIITPAGGFVDLWSVGPDEINEVPVDGSSRDQTLVIPFSVADQLADNTEVNTGFVLVAGMVLQPFPYVKVVTIDATETLDVGTGEVVPADGGDANGFVSALALDTAGIVADTGSALLSAVEYIAPPDHLTWTLSAGADTATGYIFLPYRLITTGTPIIG